MEREKFFIEKEKIPLTQRWAEILEKYQQFLEEDFSKKEKEFFEEKTIKAHKETFASFLDVDLKKAVFIYFLSPEEKETLKEAIEKKFPAAHQFEGVFYFLKDLEKESEKEVE